MLTDFFEFSKYHKVFIMEHKLFLLYHQPKQFTLVKIVEESFQCYTAKKMKYQSLMETVLEFSIKTYKNEKSVGM